MRISQRSFTKHLKYVQVAEQETISARVGVSGAVRSELLTVPGGLKDCYCLLATDRIKT